jgi:hypothetical protein
VAQRCLAGRSPAHPRLAHRASIRAQVSSTRSWEASARTQGFKGVARAPTAAGTEKGRRGARRRAGAGAAVRVQDKEGWRSVAHHSRTKMTSLPTRKKLR